MRCNTILLGLATLAMGKEIPKDPKRAAEIYDSGYMHEHIMHEKEAFWEERDAARMSSFAAEPPYMELHFAQCRDGKAIP